MRNVFSSPFVVGRFALARTLAFAVALAALCLKPAAAADGKNSGVNIPDKNLAAAIRSAIHDKRDKPDQPLTEDDLRKLNVLTAKGKGIANLTGLEHCTGLMALDLSNNSIVDIKPLANLTKLQTLTLSHNRIKDISPLGKLTGLQYLEVTDNHITSVDGLSELKQLTAFYAENNKIADLGPLATLGKLWTLSVNANQIQDLTPIESLTKLSVLCLNDNRIADLSPLAKHQELHLLLLERNKISDFTPLVEAAKADAAGKNHFAPFLRLHISGNPIDDPLRSEQIETLKQAGVKVVADD